jgi:hypothetical protein
MPVPCPARLAFGLGRRTLLFGIHDLGSFHVCTNNGIPNLDAFCNKLAANIAN